MVRALGILFLPLCALGLPAGKEPAAALISLAARPPNASAAMCSNGSLANCTGTYVEHAAHVARCGLKDNGNVQTPRERVRNEPGCRTGSVI